MCEKKITGRHAIPGHDNLDDAKICSSHTYMGNYGGTIAAKHITVNYCSGQIRCHIFYGASQSILDTIDLEHDDIRCAHTVLNEDGAVIYQRGVGQDPAEDWSVEA